MYQVRSPANDEKALAEAIIKVIENAQLRKELGENARKKIQDKFDINKNVAQYIKLFEHSSANTS